MSGSSLTSRQIAASRAHIDALRAYRNAAPGERTRTKRRLEAAAVEILAAHNEAEKMEKAA